MGAREARLRARLVDHAAEPGLHRDEGGARDGFVAKERRSDLHLSKIPSETVESVQLQVTLTDEGQGWGSCNSPGKWQGSKLQSPVCS